MNKLTKTVLAASMLSMTLGASESQSSFSIEVDPATYIFHGYSLHMKKSFATIPKWQFGVGFYAMDFPDVLVNLNKHNRDKGWEQRIDSGIGFFVDYFFQENQQGLFIGAQLAQQKYKLDKNNETTEYTTMLSMGHIGYQYDFYKKFYIKPWTGIGYQNKVSGENTLFGEEFEIDSLVLFATVHIGYKF